MNLNVILNFISKTNFGLLCDVENYVTFFQGTVESENLMLVAQK